MKILSLPGQPNLATTSAAAAPPSTTDKLVHFWLNQLNMPVANLHPLYFESECMHAHTMQQEYMHRLCELFAKALLKDISASTALPFMRSIPFSTPRALAFLNTLRERYGADALLEAGFAPNTIELASNHANLQPYTNSNHSSN